MIEVHTNKYYLPTDRRNNAYSAAEAMIKRFAGKRRGTVRIDIRKNIPVAAGMAGGSGNGAAVLHGLSFLWDLGLSVRELCGIAAELGADMPEEYMPETLEFRNIELKCDCSGQRIERALMAVGSETLKELIEEDGEAELSCRFCGKKYHFDKEELEKLLAETQDKGK